jgi:hypothetical protein
MGSPALRGSGFDPTPHDAGGGVMPCLCCLDWRCMTYAHPEALSSRHLAQHGLLAKGLQGWSLCHKSSRGVWCPVLALLVMRSHLGNAFASCSCSDSMPVGIGRSVGCLL